MSEQFSVSASPWLTADEAAQRARTGVKTIYSEVAAGRLRAARVGGRRALRLRPEWVDAWLDLSATPVDVGPADDRRASMRVVNG